MASVASQKVTPINDQMEVEMTGKKELYKQQEKTNSSEEMRLEGEENGHTVAMAPPPIPAAPTRAPAPAVEDHKQDDHHVHSHEPSDQKDEKMESNENNKVIGLDDLAPRESHDSRPSKELEDDDQAGQLRFLLKQVAINRQIEAFRNMFTYDYMKSSMQWFLESATCRISITVSL